MGFLKSLFAGNKKVAEPERKEPQSIGSMESMSLAQVLDFMRSFKGSIPNDIVTDLHKRLNEIALYDHHLDQETRERAWQMLGALNKDIEKGNANNPTYLQALREASEFMVSNVRFFGVESLKWLAEEHAIAAEEIVPFAMKPEHGHLVADFLAALGAETLTQVKNEFVKHLILARRHSSCTNAVLILHGLAAKGDKATLALFSEAELAVLVGAPDDYIAARQLLVNLSLLPEESNALPFVPAKDPAHMIGLMREAYGARDKVTNDDSRMQMVGDEGRKALMQSALAIQRLHLIRRMVGQVHGHDMAEALLNVLSEGAARDVAKKYDGILTALENAPAGTPIDFMLLSQFMEGDGIKLDTDEAFQYETPWMVMCAEWLSQERVDVLDYTRFLLRWDHDHVPPQAKTEADESISDFIMQTYLMQGSRAGLAEKTLPYLEDWIGTHA